MITGTILMMIVEAFNVVLSWGGAVDGLPFDVDDHLATAVAMFKQFAIYFPPLMTMFYAFLVYLTFHFGIRMMKIIPVVRNVVSDVYSHTTRI